MACAGDGYPQEEFRMMADGVRGRKPHRPAQVPKYEYEKHRAPIKVDTD